MAPTSYTNSAWTLLFAHLSGTMSRTVDQDARITRKMIEVWGTADRISPEELDPREVWWRDRYQQLSNHGYLLRPRYSPQWAPSWKTSNRDRADSEDSKRLNVRNVPFSRYCLTTCHTSLTQSLMQLALRMERWSL